MAGLTSPRTWPDSVAFGDARYDDIRERVKKSALRQGPAGAGDAGLRHHSWQTRPIVLTSYNFGAALVTIGFRPNYKSWVQFPDAFDAMGFPIQVEWREHDSAGAPFHGCPLLRKRSSADTDGRRRGRQHRR